MISILLLAAAASASTLPIVAWSSGSALTQPKGQVVSFNAVSDALSPVVAQAGVTILLATQVQSHDLHLVKSAQSAVAGAQSALLAPFVSGDDAIVSQLLPQATPITVETLAAAVAQLSAASTAAYVVQVDSACPKKVSAVVAAVVAALAPIKSVVSVVLAGAPTIVAAPKASSLTRRSTGLIAPAPIAADPTTAPGHRLVKHYQWFTTPIVMGLFVGFLILFFVFIGNYGLMTTETSERMPSTLDKFLAIPNN